MSPNAATLTQLRLLSVADRIRLVEELWDSIAEDAPEVVFPMSAELAAELDRRVAEADANPEAGRSWEEVRARLLSPDRRGEVGSGG